MPRNTVQKLFIPLIVNTILLSILITLQCRIFDPAEYETTADIELYPVQDTSTGTDLTYFINDTVVVIIRTRHTGTTDSIVCRNSLTDSSITIHDTDFVDSITVRFTFNQPAAVTLYADAYSAESVTTTDSILVHIIPKDGENRRPEIGLAPSRKYAGVAVPCTISVAFNDSDFWQTMSSIAVEGVDTSQIRIRDSLVIFTPYSTDTVSSVELSITATDNGVPPESDTKTITVVLSDDGKMFDPPTDIRVVERSDETVTISWEGDSLADGYTVFRSLDVTSDKWDTAETVTGTTFTDTTDSVFFYRVVTDNFFGSSEPGPVVLGSDTLHYGHAIGFKSEESVVSEGESTHTITIEVSREALMPITVYLSATGKDTDSARITLDTTEVMIEEGDTSVEVPLTIRDNDENNGPETLTVTIESVSSGYIAGILAHKVIVIDNDTFYTVTYDRNGADDGEVPVDDNRYGDGATVTVSGNSGNLTKEDYTFTGWNTKTDGNGTGYVANDEFKMDGEDVTLYAQWEKVATYSVNYDGNGHSDGTPPVDSTPYEENDEVIVKDAGSLEKTNFAFSGWNTESDGSGIAFSAGDTLTIETGAITLFAVWDSVFYTVTFNSQEGSDVSVQRVVPDGTVTEPEIPSREGYRFDGWYKESSCLNGWDFTNATVVKDITLFAKWTRVFTVTYKGNTSTGGSVPVDANRYENSSTVTVLSNSGGFEKTGYTFVTWNTEAGGTGTKRTSGGTFTMGSVDVELYAQWDANSYTITFNKNDDAASGEMAEISMDCDETAAMPDNGFSKEGWSFSGWATTSDGEASYENGADFTMGAGDDTLYAKWIPNRYRVTYDGNAQTAGSQPEAKEYDCGKTVTVASPGDLVKTGYTFTGWSNDNEMSFAENDTFTLGAEDVMLSAIWEANTYHVTFNANSDSATGSMEQQDIVFGTSADLTPCGFSKIGHHFDGWATVPDGERVYGDGVGYEMLTEDAVLYAHWTLGIYNVTFNPNSDGVSGNMDQQQIVFGTSVNLMQNIFSKTGHSFSGWATDPNGDRVFDDEAVYSMLTEGSILYAKWLPNKYNVSFNSNGTGVSGSMAQQQIIFGTSANLSSNGYSRNGYSFNGWMEEGSGTVFNNEASYTMLTEGITLNAQWNADKYTITYHVDVNGNKGNNPEDYTIESSTISFNDASRTSYIFDGWYSDVSYNSIITSITSGSVGNREVWAKWIIKDADGNIYTERKIGDQVWMVENLKTTKFNDGTQIPLVTDNASWDALSTPAYCWYENDLNSKNPNGALYNWYTVGTGMLAPSGWHVPTETEWNAFLNYLRDKGYQDFLANSIASQTGWEKSSEGGPGYYQIGNNYSGFNGFPTGSRSGEEGTFWGKGSSNRWWLSTVHSPNHASRFTYIAYDKTTVTISGALNTYGFSVRCIRDY